MAIPRFDAVLHKAADADESVGDAYRALLSFKQSMDEMEEIPRQLLKVYDQTMRALDALGAAGDKTHQLRMMVRRLPR